MKLKQYLYLSLLFILISSSTLYFLYNNNQTKIQATLDNESQIMDAHYKSIYLNFEKLADTVFYGYVNTPEILKAFKEEDRVELYKKLNDKYSYLSSIDFKQLHFHTKDNMSFLRMHKPSKFGDDLTDVRYSVKYVNQSKKAISGLEMGRIFPGFRFVYPLYQKGEHIGSVETSFGVRSFANKLTDIYNIRANFLLDKNIANKKLFHNDRKNYVDSIESQNYVIYKNNMDNKIKNNYEKVKEAFSNKLKTKIKEKLHYEKLFSIHTKINNFDKIITFIPVRDIEKNHLGYFVIYRNSEEISAFKKEFRDRAIISVLILLGIFGFIIRELRHKESLQAEVKRKTKELSETARKLEEQTVELEELNDSLEMKIEEEVLKNAKQERELFQQSKQAALGDMIGNIAHQWRQPLSAISTSASGMQLTHYSGVLTDEDFISYTDAIIRNSKYLSQTIDDFRDFIKSDKRITRFDVKESIEKCLAIVNSSINNHNLNVEINLEENLITSNYENELQQAIINIFSNAKDALKDRIQDTDDRIIFISAYKKETQIEISIKDTAGGIDFDIMDKIFEPYFTTKHQSQGTGLGLYMTHQIIVDSMKGTISVENTTFNHNDKIYTGAEFIISLKLS